MSQIINAILFDVDGTLIDSAPGILSTMREVFSRLKVDITGVDLMRYVGPPLRASFAEHFSEDEEIERATIIYREIYHETGRYQATLYPGVVEMLQSLKENGYLLCTATSKPTQVVTPILERLGIADYFTVIGGASFDKKRDNKTAVIEYVLNQPELKGKTCVMIGDRKEDLVGASDCNLPSIAVRYGYGTPQEFEGFEPLFLADHCEELTRYLVMMKNGEKYGNE